MGSLFCWKRFRSHSGLELNWKIDCDFLSDKDLDCLARLVASKFPYERVYPVPTGGIRFAEALERNKPDFGRHILLVDDVLTTGNSLIKLRQELGLESDSYYTIGIVIFARTHDIPNWIKPIFVLAPEFRP